MKFKRLLKPILKEAIQEFPAIFIAGARQVGKSTLSMELANNYVTFDDINAYLSAKNDPNGFINSLELPVILDEVQKVPEIFNVIKQKIDKNRKPNQFILTGSINLLKFSTVKESLAGRLAIFELYPLSIYEIQNKKENLIEKLFTGKFLEQKNTLDLDIWKFILKGGFPEIHKIKTEKMRYIWFSSYVSTYIEKDVIEIGEIRNIDKFLNLLHVLASYSGNILNKSKISQITGIDGKTLDNYLNLLQLIYQITILKPFSQNIGKRFVKSPKIYFNDTGLLCYLLGITSKEE
ncbi:AAA family ATPase, partial [Persephonella sp.]